MSGTHVPGHQNCLICHPELSKRERKARKRRGVPKHSVKKRTVPG